ncbi:MFS transporter [Thermoflexus sp.]|uniref:MFS transporter n=1 Tax=Thermoflexus sp. TaxID=1969742 RepID=UPI00331E16A7
MAPPHPARRMVRLLLLSEILWALGEGLFFYFLPVYIQELGAAPVQIGLAIGAAEIALTVTYLPMGWLADRMPHKPLMLGGWFAGTLGAVAMAAARDWPALVPGLTLYLLSGYCLPIIHAYVARMAGPIPLERVLPLLNAAYALGGIFPPILGGWLAQRLGMRTVLRISAAFFILSTVAALLLPADPRPPRPTARSLSLGQGIPWRFGLALLLVFTVGQTGFVLLPNFLEGPGGWSRAHLGLFAALQALGGMLLGPLLGRWDEGRVYPIGMVAAWGLAGLGLGLLATDARRWETTGPAMLLAGGAYAAYALAAARVLRMTPTGAQATAAALAHTARSLAMALAAPLAGALFAADPRRPLQVACLLLPPALGLAAWAGRLPATSAIIPPVRPPDPWGGRS